MCSLFFVSWEGRLLHRFVRTAWFWLLLVLRIHLILKLFQDVFPFSIYCVWKSFNVLSETGYLGSEYCHFHSDVFLKKKVTKKIFSIIFSHRTPSKSLKLSETCITHFPYKIHHWLSLWMGNVSGSYLQLGTVYKNCPNCTSTAQEKIKVKATCVLSLVLS